MTKTRHYGQLYRNRRRRDEKDPQLLGWLQFGNGKASVAAFTEDAMSGNFTLTIKPWAMKRNVFTYGALSINPERKLPNSPQFIGTVAWGGAEYSVCGWLSDERTEKAFIKLTAERIEQ